MFCLRALHATVRLLAVVTALRDSNDKSVSVGVGKIGQSWLLPEASMIDVTHPSEQERVDDNESSGNLTSDEATPPLKLRRYGDEDDYWWDYNPFRVMIPEGLRDDTECPNVEDFPKEKKRLTKGEKGMCLLRYSMLRLCRLRNKTCTTCPCPEEGCMRKLRDCYGRLLPIWAREYLAIPFAIFLGHLLLAPGLNFGYTMVMQWWPLRWFVTTFIGSNSRDANRPHLIIYLELLQIFVSVANTILFCFLDMLDAPMWPWIQGDDYEAPWLGWFQLVVNIQMLINFYIFWVKSGFQWSFLLHASSLIDILTVHGNLSRQMTYDSVSFETASDTERTFLFFARPKMHLHFLRSYRCLTAWLAVEYKGPMRKWRSTTRQFVRSALSLFALVVLFTGTAAIFEWIGHDLRLEPQRSQLLAECRYQDLKQTRFTDGRTDSRNISCAPFIVGLYWVFTTMCTLGAGDYVPHTIFSYALVIVMIITGITFLWGESKTLHDTITMFGRGKLNAVGPGGHVVITGGAMRDVDTHVLYQFISQMLHQNFHEQGCEWPRLVILGEVEHHQDVSKFLDSQLTANMRKQIQFCNGDPLSAGGCNQAKVAEASIVYILPSSKIDDFEAEDEYSMHVALSVKSLSQAQAVPFRVVLYRASSMQLAVMSGLHPGQCFCLDQFRTSILAQGSLVRGWPLLITLLTSNASWNDSDAKQYCKTALFPDAYQASCANSIWGFALSANAAGRPFHEVSAWIYREMGALPICAQLDGKVKTFPWHQIIPPETVIYCIHDRNPKMSEGADFFCSRIDWRPQFVKNREDALAAREGEESTMKRTLSEAIKKEVQKGGVPLLLSEMVKTPPEIVSKEVLSEEDMQIQRAKAEDIKASGKDFILVVMTAVDDFWKTFVMYAGKVGIAGHGEEILQAVGMIVLVPKPPPVDMADAVRARDPKVQLAFCQGDWTNPADLKATGAEQCKCVLTYPLHMLRASPDNDTRTFFFLRLLTRLNLRPECNIVTEVTSGMAGAHMMPVPKSMDEQDEWLPKQPPSLQEDAFSPLCASGQVFVPRSLLGLVAKSFYVFGIVEAMQHLIQSEEKTSESVRPEQIYLPDDMIGKAYWEIVEAFLANRWKESRLGPCPAVVVGILRETLYMEAVMLHPARETRTVRSDLLIVLATGEWAKWAQDRNLRCIGGRARRTANGM